MKNKYFNENGFQYAQNIIETNPMEAKIRFENYLSSYPDDYYARSYYVLLLIRIGKIKQAYSEYNYIEKRTNNNYNFAQSNKRMVGFNCIMALAKAKLLAYEEKYQELLDFYKNNPDLFEKRGDTALLSYFCRYKLGKITPNEIKNNSSYRFLQVVDYSEERFLEHIKKHQVENNLNTNEQNISQFNIDFPIQKVITEIKKIIPNDKLLYLGLFDTAYFFKYDNCGHVNSKSSNFFKLITFYGTQSFITMCPILEGNNLPYIDLNYMVLENNEKKVKTLSQIDKFNKRFNRN